MKVHHLLSVVAAAACVAHVASAQTTLLGAEFRDGLTFTNTARIFDVDPVTGAATNPRFTGSDVLADIAFGPDGLLYAFTDGIGVVNGVAAPSSLLTIDPATGATTVVGSSGLLLSEGDLAFQPGTGTLFGISTVNGVVDLITFDTTTGAASVVGTLAITGDGSGLAFDDAGQLFVLDTTVINPSTEAFLYRVDPTNADILATTTINTGLGVVAGLEFDAASGNLLLADGDFNGTDTLYNLDPATGDLTPVGTTTTSAVFGGLSGLTFIPEPGVLGIGGVLILALVRRR